MSRKIKINTVNRTDLENTVNTTDLENTLNKNLCKKHVTISGPEKTIVVSNDTTPCSDEELKAQLERDKEVKKEIRKTINDSKNAVKRYQEATYKENIGDANADTKIELDTYDYYVMAEEYINRIILPLFIKADSENANNIDSMKLVNFQSMLVSLFKEHNIMSLDDAINNKKLYDIVIADLIVFNFNENLVDHEHLVKFLSERTPETFCQQLLKRYPNLKEKTSALMNSMENNPLEENKENRILVATDSDNKDIEYARKLIKENIIPRINELNRLEEETRKIKNLPLDVTKPYEEVNHPDHYNVYDVEVVEMMERIFGIEETMSWCKLNAFKYRMRAGEKPTSTIEKDLKKEKWCLNKYKELKSKK